MSINLEKNHPTYASVPFGELIVRGRIFKINDHTMTVKVESVTGNSGVNYTGFMVGYVGEFQRTNSNTYRI